MPHGLFLTRRQATKIKKAFVNNISTDIRLSKVQMSKIIQSGVFFASWSGNLGKKTLTNVAIPLARDSLPGLVSNLASNEIKKIWQKISAKGALRAGNRFYFIYLKWRYECYH